MQKLITTIFPGNTKLSVESKGSIADSAPTATLLATAFKHMDLIVRSEDIDASTELFNVSAFKGKDRVARLELATRDLTRSLLFAFRKPTERHSTHRRNAGSHGLRQISG